LPTRATKFDCTLRPRAQSPEPLGSFPDCEAVALKCRPAGFSRASSQVFPACQTCSDEGTAVKPARFLRYAYRACSQRTTLACRRDGNSAMTPVYDGACVFFLEQRVGIRRGTRPGRKEKATPARWRSARHTRPLWASPIGASSKLVALRPEGPPAPSHFSARRRTPCGSVCRSVPWLARVLFPAGSAR